MHDVSFALGAEFAGSADGLFGTEFFKIVVVANASGNEATFEIGVDSAGGLGGGGAFFDGPGAAFFFAGGEEGLEAERFVGGFDELAEGVVFDAVGLEKFFAFISVHAGHLFFEFGINKDGFGGFY